MRRHPTCDLVDINSVPARTDVPSRLCLASPQRHGYIFKNMWLADPITQPKAGGASTGLSHQAKCAATVKAASAWREWGSLVWSCGCLCLKEQRRVGSDRSTNPPLLWLSRPPLLSAPLPENWTFSLGEERTAGVSCYHANSPCYPLKTWESQRRGRRERSQKKCVFHSTLALYYATILCLIVSWHGNEQPS